MAKPIFVIRIPEVTPRENLQAIEEAMGKMLDDYHSIVVISKQIDITFEMFNITDAPNINFESLKKELCSLITNSPSKDSEIITTPG